MQPTLTVLSTQQVLGLIFGILLFAAILGGFAYFSKRLSKLTFSGRRIKVLDRTMLTREASVLIVQVGLRLLAVGVGKNGVSLLCELAPGDFEEFSASDAANGTGFWSRFARNLKTNMTGTETSADSSFSELLQKISEKNPVVGVENTGDTGYGHVMEEEPFPKVKRHNYQAIIDNMSRLSEPDSLDRRMRVMPAAIPRPEPQVPGVRQPSIQKEEPLAETEERAERIDQLLDLIAQRQSKLDDKNRR